LQQKQAPELDVSAPEANAYEFQSGGVVEMLEKLQDEFSSKKTELEKEELGAQQGFEQIMQQLADNIKNAQFEISKKTKQRAQTQENKAEFEGDLAQTTADRDEDQKYLDDTVALCKQKTEDYENRQKLRAGELQAIDQAIEIIGSKTVAGAGEKYLPSLVQVQNQEFQQCRPTVHVAKLRPFAPPHSMLQKRRGQGLLRNALQAPLHREHCAALQRLLQQVHAAAAMLLV